MCSKVSRFHIVYSSAIQIYILYVYVDRVTATSRTILLYLDLRLSLREINKIVYTRFCVLECILIKGTVL